jgi:hypothetical protein
VLLLLKQKIQSAAQILMQYDDQVLGVEVERQLHLKNYFESFFTEIPQRLCEYEEKLKSSGTEQ